MSKPQYLGDSVYIELADNGMLKLTTNNGEGPTNTIYLDSAVFTALLQYVQALQLKPKE
jgi:hypothetical protein